MPANVLVLILALATARSASAADAGKHDPCSFLKVNEIEAVMSPLAGPPYRASGRATPSPNGGDCRYEAQERRSIRLTVEWQGGKTFMSMRKRPACPALF